MEELNRLLQSTQSQVNQLTQLIKEIQSNSESNQMSIIKNVELIGEATIAISKNMDLITDVAKSVKNIDERLKQVESFYSLSSSWSGRRN